MPPHNGSYSIGLCLLRLQLLEKEEPLPLEWRTVLIFVLFAMQCNANWDDGHDLISTRTYNENQTTTISGSWLCCWHAS